MKNNFRTIITLLLFFIFQVAFLNCKKQTISLDKQYPVNIYFDLFNNHPSGDTNLYNISKPWNERVYSLDEVHKDYAVQLNKIDGFPEIPKPYKKMKEMYKIFQKIGLSEPPELKKIKNKLIYGIYIASNLGGTGITGFVHNKENSLGGFILIDGDLISKKANQWISAKESSVFQESLHSTISIKIANKKDNTIESAMEYILLHEMAHILAQTMKILPDQRDKFRKFDEYEFSKNAWIDEVTSIYDNNLFSLRKEIQFYDDESIFFIERDSMKIYNQLEKTSFPTLYASMNPDEHFAESFVSYIHLNIYNNPWELEVDTPSMNIKYKNGINQERCKRDKDFIKKMLIDCKKNL